MKKRVFRKLIASRFAQHTYACVGLDSDYAQIVEIVRRPSIEKIILDFNCPIIDATRDLVCAYKINIAGYQSPSVIPAKAGIQTRESGSPIKACPQLDWGSGMTR